MIEVEALFEPRDLWVGVRWDKPVPGFLEVYICFLPCLPIKIAISDVMLP